VRALPDKVRLGLISARCRMLLDPDKQAALARIIDKVPFVEAINDAWRLVALATLGCSLSPP